MAQARPKCRDAQMEIFTRVFTPSKNRRLNELVGFLLFAAAVLLFLALVSYSPLDNSWNTAATSPDSSPARNWIGVVGAMTSDLLLQSAGVTIFLLPLMIGMLGSRWFKSRPVDSPIAKCIGASALMLFVPALFALLPWHLRFRHAAAMEGLIGRVFGDALIHYFNLIGAYIVCAGVITAALYLSTAFSLGAARLWMETRFAFAFALRDRFTDWMNARKAERLRRAEAKAKANATKPVLTTQLIQKKPWVVPAATPAPAAPAPAKSGIERMAEEMETHQPVEAEKVGGPEVGSRADIERKGKTIMPKVAGGYKLPSTALLHRPDAQHAVDEDELKDLAQVLVSKCAEFDVHGKITQINPGPVVTTYEMKPEAGIKYSRITGLQEDLCLALRAESVLIERMPGKATVGIQVPNRDRETIWLREVIEAEEFSASKSRLTLAMGKDINGRIITADLATMPHLLIAGSTGAGKSVAINAMIMSILYKATPDQCRLILVDPKRLELGNYEGVPHLYTPIITEPKLAANALRNAVREMERRLKVLAERGVRNIEQYNKSFDEDKTPSLFEEATENEHKPLPYIVIIIDELADLMMLDQSNVEESITRLAQMARAVGIHLILATQRPSVDVITGLIKANFPARISFRVATKIDSRTILDANGAESLLGRGDMLYLPSGSARVVRVHAPLVTEKEIAAAVEFWRAQGLAQYEEKFLQAPKEEGSRADSGAGGEGGEDEHDPMFEDAVRLVLEFGKASTSLIQRRLRVGYGRAAHLIDLMERDGIVGPADGPKPREILKKPDWLSEVEEAMH
jgi:DNA segregation ATPase FtsK/SpoIIIE, S-DNA-T family